MLFQDEWTMNILQTVGVNLPSLYALVTLISLLIIEFGAYVAGWLIEQANIAPILPEHLNH